ncbi:MAG: TIGR04283 family arsenosugar biosynthesis glycosyltransferase [Verrucomicrobiales bacterium]|nr:TIGR04283 family arsenosugar biosynthesis glycosyltransferase [Verrucomicrobiales bacterium]
MSISVIIPTLNEAENLAAVLEALAWRKGDGNEVIVVDGGSGDGTQEIAKKEGAQVLACVAAGRAMQMNRGTEAALGEILFFLHGDTLVPDGALDLIAELCSDAQVVGGGFLRQFDSDSRWLDWTCRLADWRSENWGVFLGDQGIFVRRAVFDQIGGFDENLSCCEDLRFSMQLRERGEVVALRPAVLSSARRFDKWGPLRTTLRDACLAARALVKR